jgi:hypothetical protein
MQDMQVISAAHIGNLRREVGFAWGQILVLALSGVAAGVVLALILSLRVS